MIDTCTLVFSGYFWEQDLLYQEFLKWSKLTNLMWFQAGQFVAEGVTRFLVIVISNATELQGYVVRTLYRSFQDWRGQVGTYATVCLMFSIWILLTFITQETSSWKVPTHLFILGTTRSRILMVFLGHDLLE
jgi:hypothetical protein